VKPKARNLLVLAALTFGAPLLAQTKAATLVAGGGGQQALAARVIDRDLVYKVCATPPCEPTASDGAIHLPAGTGPADMALEVLAIGEGRHVLWARSASFGAVVASVPGETSARVLWSGPLGFTQGEPGERRGEQVQVTEPEADGSVRVLLGQVREDVSICGRTSILSPRVLDPRDLSWKGAMVQRLTRKERDAATVLTAEPAPADLSPVVARILVGVAASTAIGVPAALTDGDPETTWSEQRGGDGRGEFVQMNAPEQAEIRAITFVFRPPERKVPQGVAPRTLWLATSTVLYKVAFPEDGWARAGSAYEVRLPQPVSTRCLALVLDEAWAHGKVKDLDVTLAEVTARTEFDDNPDVKALAGALAGGQARSRMAAALLARAGTRGFEAVLEAYPKLDDAGHVLALEIIDSAPCETSAPLYVKAMTTGKSGEVMHALDRIVRCGRGSTAALTSAIANGSPGTKIRAATALATVAPDVAVARIVGLLASATANERTALRAALAHACRAEKADEAIKDRLADPGVPAVATVDLLRSLSPRPELVRPVADALVRVLGSSADLRTRYLVMRPAARLAVLGEPRAEAIVAQAITADVDPHVRAGAAEAASALARLAGPLSLALQDADPRVREAALGSLSQIGGPQLGSATTQMLVRLASDPWTFVRARAADALGAAPRDDKADAALGEALANDGSPRVRARVAEALGKRGARSQASALRKRLDDPDEDLDVRGRSARALGRLCDTASIDLLSAYVRRAALPGADASLQTIGIAAAAALGQLAPPDLARRIAPLEASGVPKPLAKAARAAREAEERCVPRAP
jgi:HEAT repeat protein